MPLFIPSSERYFIRALFFGMDLYERNSARNPSSLILPPSSFFPSSVSLFPSSIFVLASARNFVARFFWTLTRRSTSGWYSSNIWSSPFGMGPEMISGVRASSMSTESTSSTMA